MKITNIHARQILDSRGNPTVEADVYLEDGSFGRASVPSGASTGENEAIELRDGDKTKFLGKSVYTAVANVNEKYLTALKDQDAYNQSTIDQIMLDLDGTENKSNLGANAILAVSLATAKAAADSKKLPLFRYFQEISNTKAISLPLPMMNIINGGKHAAGSTDIQEFMILPVAATSISQAIQIGAEIFQNLAKVLHEAGYPTTVGDEGGFAPSVKNGNAEALDLISQAVQKAGYTLGKDILLGLDVAASELYSDGKYSLKTEGKTLTSQEMINWLSNLTENYPIISIEDGLDQNDWQGWQQLTEQLGDKIQLVGDDLLVTNPKFLQKAIDQKSANAILVKVNQIGTLSETIEAVKLAKENDWNTIISHRSGETEDTTIADLSVGLDAGQIKTGSLSRSDRTAKYNQLIRIEESQASNATFAGNKVFAKFK